MGIATTLARWGGIAALLAVAGCGRWADKLACGQDDCTFSKTEWQRLESLADKSWGEPAPDTSNRVLPIDFETGALEDAAHPEDDPAVRFGWLLYYDPRLSGPATWIDTLGRPTPSARAPEGQLTNISCATCHDPARAGSDFTSLPGHVSVGAGWYDVNIQQTLNVAYFPILYWNGRTDSLWAQAAQVMESPVSMNGDRLRSACVVASGKDAESTYLDRYEALFGPFPSALVARFPADCSAVHTGAAFKALTADEQNALTLVHVNVAKAIAAYEWVLRSGGSAFDRFVAEGTASSLLSPSAKRGAKLFVGRASCIDCHQTPLFSDGKFHDIGIAQVGAAVPTVEACSDPAITRCVCTSADKGETCLPWGAFAGLRKLAITAPDVEYRRDSQFADAVGGEKTLKCFSDAGRKLCTGDAPTDPSFKGRWRTPSLRDVGVTGPYMHDGSLATLEDVVWHYDEGVLAPLGEAAFGVNSAAAEADGGADAGVASGMADQGGKPAPELHPLHLSAQDRADLVAFLRSLTGQPRFPVLHVCPAIAGASCKTNPVTSERRVVPSTTPPAPDAGASTDSGSDVADAADAAGPADGGGNDATDGGGSTSSDAMEEDALPGPIP